MHRPMRGNANGGADLDPVFTELKMQRSILRVSAAP
jgi:hypothetical protein